MVEVGIYNRIIHGVCKDRQCVVRKVLTIEASTYTVRFEAPEIVHVLVGSHYYAGFYL